MTQACRLEFDEALLSGYVDQELTQADSQRVQLHLEACDRCRALVEDLSAMREAAMTTPFAVPTDEQWREQPRTSGSRWLRRTGWLLLIVWIIGAGSLAIGSLISGSEPWFQKLLVMSLLAGGALLLASVLIDRLRALKTDRYRGVEK